MPIIKSSDAPDRGLYPGFNFDDLSHQANDYLAQVRRQAHEIIEQAQREAAASVRRFEMEARAAAEDSVQRRVEELANELVQQRVQTLVPAFEQAIDGIQQARGDCMARFEREAVRLAAAIAGRIVRRELERDPTISLSLLREALDLAAGETRLRIRLNPVDFEAFGEAARSLVPQHAAGAYAEFIADPQVSLGGCVVETEHGRIDQQIESQLARIEQELLE